MKQVLNILGVVGARSGSKSIRDKNIYPLLGKPLMAWIIESAKKSKYLTKLIVSTDSKKYAKIARSLGVEVPFLRPKELAEDHIPDIDYLVHATLWLEQNQGWKADIILRLPPTSPLCQAESIDRCIELLLNDPKATSARTIKSAPKHPYKLWRIENDILLPFIPKELTGFAEPSNMPRQALIPAYAHVDVIAVRYNTLVIDKLLTGKRVRYHLLPKTEVVDIDSELDLIVAEILLKKRRKAKI